MITLIYIIYDHIFLVYFSFITSTNVLPINLPSKFVSVRISVPGTKDKASANA